MSGLGHRQEILRFDRFLSECSISSLTFLSHKYNKELSRYKVNYDLDRQEYWIEYKRKQDRKKMIDKELRDRIMNKSATIPEHSSYLDSNSGLIYDEDNGNIIGSTDMDPEYGAITVRDYDGNVINRYTEDEPEYNKKKKYKDWKYWE